MSIKYMSAVWEDTLLEGNERLVMLAIADSGCGVDAPLPTLETISHKANLSVERTRQIIKSLVAKGYLNIEVQP